MHAFFFMGIPKEFSFTFPPHVISVDAIVLNTLWTRGIVTRLSPDDCATTQSDVSWQSSCTTSGTTAVGFEPSSTTTTSAPVRRYVICCSTERFTISGRLCVAVAILILTETSPVGACMTPSIVASKTLSSVDF